MIRHDFQPYCRISMPVYALPCRHFRQVLIPPMIPPMSAHRLSFYLFARFSLRLFRHSLPPLRFRRFSDDVISRCAFIYFIFHAADFFRCRR